MEAEERCKKTRLVIFRDYFEVACLYLLQPLCQLHTLLKVSVA